MVQLHYGDGIANRTTIFEVPAQVAASGQHRSRSNRIFDATVPII
jgi:hypothetical protein